MTYIRNTVKLRRAPTLPRHVTPKGTMNENSVGEQLRDLLEMGEYANIGALLLEHQDSEDVQEQCLAGILIKLAEHPSHPRFAKANSQGRDLMKDIMVQSNIVQQTSLVMGRHLHNVKIQEYGCALIEFAFNSQVNNVDTVTPYCTVVMAAMQQHKPSPELQYRACCALDAANREFDTVKLYPFAQTAAQYDLVDLVHEVMHLKQDEEVEEKMYESCLALIATLGPGWQYTASSDEDFSFRKNSMDSAIAGAMDKFKNNEIITLNGSRALAELAVKNLRLFTEVSKDIRLVVRAFQMDYMDLDQQEASCRALTNFVYDSTTCTTQKVHQITAGRTGVMGLALCALRIYFESKNTKKIVTTIMCDIINLVYALGSACVENQQRILHTETLALFLAIAKKRLGMDANELGNTTLRLLCMLHLNDSDGGVAPGPGGGVVVDVSFPYQMVTWNKNTVDVPCYGGTNILDTVVYTMQKPNASKLLIVDGLRMLGMSASALAHPGRSATTNAETMIIIREIMLPKGKPCDNQVTRLGMVLLEKLAHYPVFASNVDLQQAVSAPTQPGLQNDDEHCMTRDAARHQIEIHT